MSGYTLLLRARVAPGQELAEHAHRRAALRPVASLVTSGFLLGLIILTIILLWVALPLGTVWLAVSGDAVHGLPLTALLIVLPPAPMALGAYLAFRLTRTYERRTR